MTIQQRYAFVIEQLNQMYPNATTELENDTPFHLLIAVILSAQCTDKRVNMVTPALFKRFPFPKDMAEAEEKEIFEYIKSISYPNSKAKYLKNTAKRIVEAYNGEVPQEVKELQTLQGVGRKTANVIASVVFNKPTMPVDTHVHRVSKRIGLTNKAKTVLQTEEQLMKHIPQNDVALLHHQLILLGRYICKARKPECAKCLLPNVCKHFQNTQLKQKSEK